MNMNKILKCVLLFSFIIGGESMSIKTVPLEDFFKNPEKSSFQLSPNGKFISYMKNWEGFVKE